MVMRACEGRNFAKLRRERFVFHSQTVHRKVFELRRAKLLKLFVIGKKGQEEDRLEAAESKQTRNEESESRISWLDIREMNL
jgi:hypothetical protein